MKFLSEILNVEKFPLTVLDRPIESETSKIVENSYSATTLAFLNEWSLFAERNGVDLINRFGTDFTQSSALVTQHLFLSTQHLFLSTQNLLLIAEMADSLIKYWGEGKWEDLSDPQALHEANLLKLCCDKAHAGLNWHSGLTIDECLQMTAAWYKKCYTVKPQESMYDSCTKQIAEYVERAKNEKPKRC